MMMDRAAVEELLRRRIGLDPASTGPGLVARATRVRMKAVGIDEADLDGYLALASRSEGELQALVEEVVIPESWFFRDEHPFALVADRASAGWLADPTRPPLRALSVPCARGEEAYSIAIALLDRGLPPSRFHVDGVDVSGLALDAARRGVYTANAFRSKDLSFRDRHFRADAGGAYTLSDRVRSAVEFHQGNLLDPALLADRAAYDMIFCRNLMIYLDEPARRLALANLDRLLSPDGLLFVGHAEQIGLLSPTFRPSTERGCFAFVRAPRKAAAEPARKALPPVTIPPKRQAAPPAIKPKAVAPAREVRKPDVPANPLEEAARLADRGQHAEAALLCEQVIRRGGSSPAPHFLLGVIRQAAGDRERAERSFEKAVYLDPGHEEALLALSLLAQRRGDLNAAAGYRRRADRAYQEKHPR